MEGLNLDANGLVGDGGVVLVVVKIKFVKHPEGDGVVDDAGDAA